MWKQNTLTQKLNIDYPIIQGPFGGGLSTVELLSTVSNAGGMGSYGAHILSPAEIYQLTKRIQAKTNKTYALNLWVSDHDPGGLEMQKSAFNDYVKLFKPHYDNLGMEPPGFPEKYTEYFEEQVEALIEAKPPVFSFVFGIPSDDLLERCRREGIVTIGAATSVDEAVAIENAGVCLLYTSPSPRD